MPIQPRQTWDEFCAEQEAQQKLDDAAVLSYQQQIRKQKPGAFISGKQFLVFFGKAVLLTAGLIVLCYGAVLVAAAWFGL